ncbi:hypothetical protein GGR51DRAFT_566478 [Nemania sp. FL0031]|nr:hypothetical protein GGR51DRAFT_566478 [Nemania sp. FL0031]
MNFMEVISLKIIEGLVSDTGCTCASEAECITSGAQREQPVALQTGQPLDVNVTSNRSASLEQFEAQIQRRYNLPQLITLYCPKFSNEDSDDDLSPGDELLDLNQNLDEALGTGRTVIVHYGDEDNIAVRPTNKPLSVSYVSNAVGTLGASYFTRVDRTGEIDHIQYLEPRIETQRPEVPGGENYWGFRSVIRTILRFRVRQMDSAVHLIDTLARRLKSQNQHPANIYLRVLLACIPGQEGQPKEGTRRVRWTCFGYRRHYDDYYYEASPDTVQEIQNELNKIYHEPMRQYKVFIQKCHHYLLLGAPFWLQSEHPRLSRFMFQLSIPTIIAIFARHLPLLDLTFFTPLAACISMSLMTLTSTLVALLVVMTPDGNLTEGTLSIGTRSTTNSTAPTGRGSLKMPGAGATNGGGSISKQTSDQVGFDVADSLRRGAFEEKRRTSWILALYEDNTQCSRYVHLNASQMDTDWALFSSLKQKYDMISSWWDRFTNLRQVSAVRFVRFNLTDEKHGDIREPDVWPPEHEPRIWIYEPYPIKDKITLVGAKHMMNLWRNPHHSDAVAYEEYRRDMSWDHRVKDWLLKPFLIFQVTRDTVMYASNPKYLDDEFEMVPWDGNMQQEIGNPIVQEANEDAPNIRLRSKYVLTRVPKREGHKLEVNYRDSHYPEAWGLRVEEGFHIHRLLFFILLCYTVGSVTFLTVLLRKYGVDVHKSDIPVAGMIVWPLSYAGLACTLWFKWAESHF